MTDTGDTPTPEPVVAAEPVQATPEPPAERSFTQTQVNAMLANSKREILAGADDIVELRKKAKELDKLKDEQKSELEKTQERLAQLEQERDQADQRAKDTLFRAAVVSEAAKKNVVDPDAAFALLDRNSIEFGDDGAPLNIADAMDALLTAKPYLAGRTPSADLGARGTSGVKQLTREDLKHMTPESRIEARKNGQLADLLAGKS